MPTVRRLTSLSALAVAGALAASGPARAEAPSDGPAIVVLDGSGSMWGQIGSEKPAKFDLARGALRQSLTTLSPRVRLGLMSFGQRRRADCNDVEVLAAPEAGGAERILSVVDRLSPKGKGPLSLALKEAAKQIPAGEAGSIVAIHDGPDNCWQDPCAAAAEIAKANPKTRIFLIGFGLAKADAAALACVASSTQGRVLEAGSSAQLATALTEALTLANLERIDPAVGVAVPAPQPATPPDAAGAPGVRLSASLNAGGEPLKAAVHWRLAKADAPDAAVETAHAPELSADLAPGDYVVEARLGQARVTQPIAVTDDGPTAARISLGAGILKLKAQADRAGKPLADPLVTLTAKDGADGSARRPVWIGRNPSVEMVVPAGTYEVRVQDGLAAQTTEVRIEEGAGADVSPVLGTGQITLSAVAAATGAPITDVRFTLEEDDPDSPQGRREIARSANPEAAFTLPAGTYYVSARSGVAETHDRIALGSGDAIAHVARFNLVGITVTAALSGAETAPDARWPILIRVLSDGANPREIARASGATGTFSLPPARYRVEAAVSGLNIKTQGVIDLANGRGGNVQLTLETGEVSVLAASGAGRHWRIKDGDGQTVLHSGRGGGTTTAHLAPGRYVLLTDDGDRRQERTFDLKAGERQSFSAEAQP